MGLFWILCRASFSRWNGFLEMKSVALKCNSKRLNDQSQKFRKRFSFDSVLITSFCHRWCYKTNWWCPMIFLWFGRTNRANKKPSKGLRGLRYAPGYLAVIGDSWDSWVNPRKMFITTVYHVFYCLWSFYELQGNRWHDTQSRRQPSVPWSCSKPENLPGPVVRPYLKMKNEGLRWVKIDILGFRFQENKKNF